MEEIPISSSAGFSSLPAPLPEKAAKTFGAEVPHSLSSIPRHEVASVLLTPTVGTTTLPVASNFTAPEHEPLGRTAEVYQSRYVSKFEK